MPCTVDRIFVWKLHLENFKSYAGKIVIGPFHPSFTCIIGPNGSGKSNIIDAMQFVFGKNARKLRLGRLTEVIHRSHGRQTTPADQSMEAAPMVDESEMRCSMARVDVVFRKMRETFDSDEPHGGNVVFSEVDDEYALTVSREVHLNGNARYLLNGRQATWGDVHAKLLEVKVDLEHNRFLILQGEVEQISQLKPKAEKAGEEGLLEYLEDIIGSNRFVEPIAVKDKEIEAVSDELSVKLSRVKTAEKERHALEGPRRAAEAYAFSAADLSHAKSASEALFRAAQQAEFAKVESSLVDLESQRAELQVEAQSVLERKADQDSIETALRTRRSAKAEEMRSLKRQWHEVERNHQALVSERVPKAERAKRSQIEINKLKGLIDKLERDLEDLSEENVEKLRRAVDSLAAEIQRNSDTLDHLTSKAEVANVSLLSRKRELEAQLRTHEERAEQLEEFVSETVAEIELLMDDVSSWDKRHKLELEQKSMRCQSMRTEEVLARQVLSESQRTLHSKQNSKSVSQKELDEAKEKFQQVSDRFVTLQREISELVAEISDLGVDAYTALNTLKSRGSLTGVGMSGGSSGSSGSGRPNARDGSGVGAGAGGQPFAYRASNSDIVLQKLASGEFTLRSKSSFGKKSSEQGRNSSDLGLSDSDSVMGKLSDIVEAEAGYETALRTALGFMGENIVVSRMSVAEELIGLVREKGLGRVTCSVLEKTCVNPAISSLVGLDESTGKFVLKSKCCSSCGGQVSIDKPTGRSSEKSSMLEFGEASPGFYDDDEGGYGLGGSSGGFGLMCVCQSGGGSALVSQSDGGSGSTSGSASGLARGPGLSSDSSNSLCRRLISHIRIRNSAHFEAAKLVIGALGQVLVAEDVNSAVRISEAFRSGPTRGSSGPGGAGGRQGFRPKVVSMDGQLVESSGSIVSSGNQNQNQYQNQNQNPGSSGSRNGQGASSVSAQLEEKVLNLSGLETSKTKVSSELDMARSVLRNSARRHEACDREFVEAEISLEDCRSKVEVIVAECQKLDSEVAELEQSRPSMSTEDSVSLSTKQALLTRQKHDHSSYVKKHVGSIAKEIKRLDLEIRLAMGEDVAENQLDLLKDENTIHSGTQSGNGNSQASVKAEVDAGALNIEALLSGGGSISDQLSRGIQGTETLGSRVLGSAPGARVGQSSSSSVQANSSSSFSSLGLQIRDTKRQIASLKHRMDEASALLVKEQNRKVKLIADKSALETKLVREHESIGEVNAELAVLNEKIERLENQVASEMVMLEQQGKELTAMDNEILELNKILESINEELHEFKSRVSALDERAATVRARAQEISHSVQSSLRKSKELAKEGLELVQLAGKSAETLGDEIFERYPLFLEWYSREQERTGEGRLSLGEGRSRARSPQGQGQNRTEPESDDVDMDRNEHAGQHIDLDQHGPAVHPVSAAPPASGTQSFSAQAIASRTAEYLANLNVRAIEQQVLKFQALVERLTPDLAALQAYRKKEEELQKLKAILDECVKRRDGLSDELDTLKKNRLDEFMTGFSAIGGHFTEIYRMLAVGGDAELEVTDCLDPFQAGVALSVRPPKKSWKNVGHLSGGERTLASLSLIFSLHIYRPTCLYFMDEIDAALDSKNVSLIAAYVRTQATGAQFTVISLRNQMFETADYIIGVYKVNHQSGVLCLGLKDTEGQDLDPEGANSLLKHGQHNNIRGEFPSLVAA